MRVTVDVPMTVEQLAEAFCGLDDEQQAQFFIEVARTAQAWKDDGRGYAYAGPGYQWFLVGKHLRTCACSTDDARDMVREIARAVGDDQ